MDKTDKTHVAWCSNDASKIKFIIEAFCPSTFWAKKSLKSLQKRVNVEI